VSPAFKLVFISVLGVTVLCILLNLGLVLLGPYNPQAERLSDSLSTAWKLGLGAIFGLLSGKTIH
jgi:hypothetical protein